MPFIVSFFRPGYLPRFVPYLFAAICVSIPFLIWDHFVTGYFWTFNPDYTTGITIGNLPVEEVMFFLTVPYSCLFIWEIITRKMKPKKAQFADFAPFFFLALFPIGIWFYWQGLEYTGSIYIVFSLTVVVDGLAKTRFYQKNTSYFFMSLIIGLTFIFNWYLTARPVVLYNEEVKTNGMVLSIPMEDFIYGLSLIILAAIVYDIAKRYNKDRSSSSNNV